MSPESIIAICYDRGLRPEVSEAGVQWVGGELTPALAGVMPYYADKIAALVRKGFVPPTVGDMSPVQTGEPVQRTYPKPFDHQAEQAVRDIYGCRARIDWKESGISIIPTDRTNMESLKRVLERVKPLRDRVVLHLDPMGPWTGNIEFKVKNYPDGHHLRTFRKQYHLEAGEKHPFHVEPSWVHEAWRFFHDSHWRMLWGYHVFPENAPVQFRVWGK